TNARHLEAAMIPETPDLATLDLSFISLTLVVPAVAGIMRPGGTLLAPGKPQFEAGRGQVGEGGGGGGPEVRAAAVTRVRRAAAALALDVRGEADSVLPGPKGNREVFLWLVRPA